jgi:FixJ family two-component response regulator
MSVRAMKAGAIEFLTKPFRGQDLLDAVQLGLERDRARRIEQLAVADLRSRFASLSGREREVMQLAATGVMNKQIAAELGLSEITVKVHRGAAMRKMRVGNFAELVLVAEKLRAAESEPG